MADKTDCLGAMISWSGTQSRAAARILRDWFECVLPGVDFWLSTEDISVGGVWFPQLMKALDQRQVCILCVTKENIRSPWMHYEAGAVAAKLNGGGNAKPLICPYLLGVESWQICKSPFSQFQWARDTKEDTWHLLLAINQALGEKSHNVKLLQTVFKSQWTPLKRKLNSTIRTKVVSQAG